jgi:hypothetical protein
MNISEQNYFIPDIEFLIIILYFEKWRQYLKKTQHYIQIFTDQHNLINFMITKQQKRIRNY